MINQLLKSIINGRNVEEMSYSTAAKVVNEFYLQLGILTFDLRNQAKVDYLASKALTEMGLEYFIV